MNANQLFEEANFDDLEHEMNTKEDHIEQQFDATALHEKMMEEATIKAHKHLKKNRKEIKRLQRHAELCLYSNNFAGYSYSIKKLRGIYKQPYNDELIKMMWSTTREALFEAVRLAAAKNTN